MKSIAMEISAIPTTPESQFPVSQRYTPATDGTLPSRKVKAINAIRSILGLFHKPTKRKEKTESPMPLTPPLLVETKFNNDTSCSLRSSPSYTGKDFSNSKFSNGTCSTDMDMANVEENDSGDALSKIGNYDDEEFQMPRQGGECDEAADDSDVFLDESYFEDDYFEDFSGDSNPEEMFPLFTPVKETNYCTDRCACNMNRETQFTQTNNTNIDNSVDFSTVRHNSTSCLTDLTSSTESLRLQNKVDEVLQIPTPYFTLGMDMVTNHFGNVHPSKDKNIKDRIESKLKDSSTETKLGVSFIKSLKSSDKRDPESSNTPIRQIYSVSDEYRTPTTPYKRSLGETIHEIPPQSTRKSISSNKLALKSRKSLYKDMGWNSLQSEDLNNSRSIKTIADGLSIVADWVLHVVGINESNTARNTFNDTEIKTGFVEWPVYVQDSHPDKNVYLPVGEKSELNQETSKSSFPSSPECDDFFSPSIRKNFWRTHFDKPQNLCAIGPTETRPRIESGYSSRSRCSTPATPLSEPPTPMNKLKCGSLMSPRSLDKLDGLEPKQTIVFQENRNQKFRFPAARRSHFLKSVPEWTESSDWSEMERVLHTGVGIHSDTMDVIISGGGDVESIKTASGHSSSESAFWSFSTVSHNHLDVSINILDENNNIVQQSPLPHLLEGLPEMSSPAVKRLQPISTSSPLQVIGSNKPVPRFHNELEKSIVKKHENSDALGTKCDPESGDKINQIAPHKNGIEMKFEKRPKSAGSRSARTCLRFEGRNANHGVDNTIESRPSRDYIVLKEAAKFIVDMIPSKIKIKPHEYITALMGNLKEHYLRIMKEHKMYGVHSIFQLKMTAEQRAASSNTITIQNSVDHFLLNVLIQRKDEAISCSDFVFQNISNILRENAAFFSLAPELIVFLLGNDRCIVKGPNGFPLPYRASEKKVLKAVVKFLDRHHLENPHARRSRRLLYQLADSSCVLKDGFHLPGTNETDKETLHLPKPLLLRARHKISYCRSHCPSLRYAKNLSHVSSALHAHGMTSAPSVASYEDRMTLFELSRKGTFSTKAPVDVRTICDEEHVLRMLYFSYNSCQGIPYIVDIGMQYESRGRKKTMFISSQLSYKNVSSREVTHDQHKGPEESESQRGSDIDNTGNAEAQDLPCQESDHPVPGLPSADPLKKAAMVLAPGEHITAVSLLGKSDVHNLEITTNMARRVRAHGMVDVPGTEWTRIPAPQDAPVCLHALVGEIQINPLRMCNFDAVWALTSWEANDLTR